MYENYRKCFKCGISAAVDPTVKLFRFPKPGKHNILRCELWAKYIFPDGNWSSLEFQQKLNREHRMLCNKHFKRTSFLDYPRSNMMLQRFAAPDSESEQITCSEALANPICSKLATAEINIANINSDEKKTQESDNNRLLEEHNENKLIEEKDIVPNKLYKVISVEGKIQLKEYSENEEISNTDHQDSTEHHDHDDCQENYNPVNNVNIIIKDNVIVKEQDVSEGSFVGSKLTESCPDPDIRNEVKRKADDEIDLPDFDTGSEENTVKHATNVDGSSGAAYKMFISKSDLAEVKNGNDMVLISLSKYKNIKKILKEMQIKINCAVKNKNMKKMKNYVLVDAKELNRLRSLKERLCRNFSEGQVNMMVNPKNSRAIAWADKELDKCSYLRQIISSKAYLFLKYQMKFPLPTFSTLRKWIIKRNVFIESKKKGVINNATDNTLETNVESEQSQNMKLNQIADKYTEQTEGTDTYVAQTEGAGTYIVQTQNTNTNTVQTTYSNTDTTQAVNSIIVVPAQGRSGENVEDPNTYTEARYDSSSELGNDTNNFICDASILPVEETVVLSQVDRPKCASMRLKCHLCMRPFDAEHEVRAHVPDHYLNTYYITYLDAQKPYQCEFCEESLKLRTQLVQHHRMHLGINPFKCWHPDCQFIGNTKSALKQHRLRHRAGLACGACPALLPTAGALLRHRALRHEGRALRRCALCGALTHNAERYRRHMRTHLRPPSMKCPEEGCEQAFYSKASLGQHRREHSGATRYTCPHCPLATYTFLAPLHRHMRRHETHKISNCSRCQLIFYDYGEFYTHCVTQHGRIERHYECVCGREVGDKKSFDKHKSKCAEVLEGLQNTAESIKNQEKEPETSPRKKPKIKKKSRKRTINTDDGEILKRQPKKRMKIVEQREAVENNVSIPKYTYVRRKLHNDDLEEQNLHYDETFTERGPDTKVKPDIIEPTQFTPDVEEVELKHLEPDTGEPAQLNLDIEVATQYEPYIEEDNATQFEVDEEPAQLELGTIEPSQFQIAIKDNTQLESDIIEPVQFRTDLTASTQTRLVIPATNQPRELDVWQENSQPQSIKLTNLFKQNTAMPTALSLQTFTPIIQKKDILKIRVINKEQLKLLSIINKGNPTLKIQGQSHQSIAEEGHSRNAENENTEQVYTMHEERNALPDMPVIALATQDNILQESPRREEESCARVQVLPSRGMHAVNRTRNLRLYIPIPTTKKK